MDFFERQEIAHKKTGRLIVLFAIAVVMILCAMNLAAFAILHVVDNSRSARRYRIDENAYRIQGPLENRPEAYIGVTLITLGIITCGSFYKIAMLAHGGGAAVAQLMAARPIIPHGGSQAETTLQNVVEEMAIASGVPVPQIFVMENEDEINAFAAGFSPADAVVCVTRGCLEKLTRDELQGVIGHEFSHILNGDMKLNLRLMGVLNGILVIGLGGYILMRSLQYSRFSNRRGRDDSGQIMLAIFFFGIAMFIIGYVGVFFGRLIQAAVSRQREYLADASSVQFTRNPMGLASALKKIGQFGSEVTNPHSMETAHLFFASGVRGGLASLLATHPPLEERIKLLDPTFKGEFPIGPGATDLLAEKTNAQQGAALASMLSGAVKPLQAANLAQRAGAATPHAVDSAAKMLASIPPEIKQAARDPFTARAVALGLLLSDDPPVRAQQVDGLRSQIDAATFSQAVNLPMANLDPGAQVAVMDLVQPAIKQLSPPQLQQVVQAAKTLIEADGRVSLFEYAMFRQLRRNLDALNQSKQPAPIAYYSTKPLSNEIATVLTALAFTGNDPQHAMQAFRAGSSRLEGLHDITPVGDFSFPALNAALDRLNTASPGVKRCLLDAAAHAVAADGVIQPEEAALLRAVCAGIDVPLPIFG